MAIACLALASMLLVHRHARFRLKAIGAIQEILLAVTDDGADLSTLELDPKLGLEAVAWNRLLGERQSTQVRTAHSAGAETRCTRSRHGGRGLGAAFDAVPYGLVLVNDQDGDRARQRRRGGVPAGGAPVLLRGQIATAITDQQVLDGDPCGGRESGVASGRSWKSSRAPVTGGRAAVHRRADSARRDCTSA